MYMGLELDKGNFVKRNTQQNDSNFKNNVRVLETVDVSRKKTLFETLLSCDTITVISFMCIILDFEQARDCNRVRRDVRNLPSDSYAEMTSPYGYPHTCHLLPVLEPSEGRK